MLSKSRQTDPTKTTIKAQVNPLMVNIDPDQPEKLTRSDSELRPVNAANNATHDANTNIQITAKSAANGSVPGGPYLSAVSITCIGHIRKLVAKDSKAKTKDANNNFLVCSESFTFLPFSRAI